VIHHIGKRNAVPALLFRAAAAFGILYQIRLFAADLAGTPFFVFTLLSAFALPVILKTRKIQALPALLTIVLVPLVCRLFIAFPRFFTVNAVTELNITLDSLLLNFDRNMFVVLAPFYWAALSMFFSFNLEQSSPRLSRRFFRAGIVIDDIIFLFIFLIGRGGSIELYRFPVVMVAVFCVIVFLQFLALIFSDDEKYKIIRYERLLAVITVFILIAVGGAALVKPAEEAAIEKGGGLLEPGLFSFDFAPYLRLQNEITMNDELVFIVRNAGEKEEDADEETVYYENILFNDHPLMRRFVLSAYNDKKGEAGFYRDGEIDEETQANRLPTRPTIYKSANRSAV
jgi:hypothetical protein